MVEGIVALGILAYCSIGLYQLTIPKPIQKKISIPRSEDQQRPLYPSTLPPSATPAMLGSLPDSNVTQIYNNIISSQYRRVKSRNAMRDLKGTDVNKDLDVRRIM